MRNADTKISSEMYLGILHYGSRRFVVVMMKNIPGCDRHSTTFEF